MAACLCCEKHCWGLGTFKDAFDVEYGGLCINTYINPQPLYGSAPSCMISLFYICYSWRNLHTSIKKKKQPVFCLINTKECVCIFNRPRYKQNGKRAEYGGWAKPDVNNPRVKSKPSSNQTPPPSNALPSFSLSVCCDICDTGNTFSLWLPTPSAA